MDPVSVFVLFIAYFIPVIIAFGRGMQRRWLLTLVCALTAWTLIGWAGALLWAFLGRSTKQAARDAATIASAQRMADQMRQPVHVTINNTTATFTPTEN